MKIPQALNLLALVTILSAGDALAQTTPTGTATGATTPTGAVAPDSSPASGRNANRANRSRNRANRNAQSTNRSQEGQYRQSSSANGTSINNSNSTNYNSNNATNAPTGVGSNPNTSNPTSTTNDSSNNPGISQSGAGSSGSTMSGGSSASASSTPAPGAPTGTGTAVKTARTTEEPAVAVGSTDRSTSIHDFVASSPNFTTLQNALQSADLSETLKGIDPYTVFAPSNSAFKKLPSTVQNTLLEGRNRPALAKLLSYHVVKGMVDTAELKRRIQTGNGKARLETLAGGSLTAQLGSNDQITLTDEQGGTARLETADTHQANGVVHGINAVLSPKGGTASFK